MSMPVPLSALSAFTRRSLAWGTRAAQEQAAGAMTATVRVRRPSRPVFDPDTNRLAAGTTLTTLYTGMARVSPVTGTAPIPIGEDLIYYSSVYVTLPFSARTPQVNDVVEVLEHPDPAAVDRIFRITDVEVGGLMPSTYRVHATGVAPYPGGRQT